MFSKELGSDGQMCKPGRVPVKLLSIFPIPSSFLQWFPTCYKSHFMFLLAK